MFHISYLYMIYHHIMYINEYIHQGLNPKTSWRCIKVFTTKPLQVFDKIKTKFNFIIFNMKLFLKFKL
jgi:hypothetical protein